MTRLPKAERRDQLLDTAAEVLLERGPGALTMEGLAARAGVSKAVPYLHFENREGVLVALYQQEIDRMTEHIGAAIAGVDADRADLGSVEAGEARIGAAIGAYLDVVERRGAVLAILAGPGSPVPAASGEVLGAHRFTADLLRVTYGLSRREAGVLGAAVFGALSGLIEAWARGEARRGDVATTAFEVATALGRSRTAVVAE